MKQRLPFDALILALTVLLSGCTNAFHNGTEMAIGSVQVTGLPASPYEGKVLLFSYDTGDQWVHDRDDMKDLPEFHATVTGGAVTYTFTDPLIISTPKLTFLLTGYPTPNWDLYQIDKKHSGKKGGNAEVDNPWTGASVLLTLKGTVSGDDVNWTLQ